MKPASRRTDFGKARLLLNFPLRSAIVLRTFARLLALILLAATASAAITLPAHPRASTIWATGRLKTTLDRVFPESQAADILIDGNRDRSLPAEAFTIHAEGDRLIIRSSDPNGELYGVLELEEQIGNLPDKPDWHQFASQFQPVRQAPYTSFRADNSFIHIDRKGVSYLAQKLHLVGPPLLFEDLEMWKRYIDQLAENRFNVLDLHGVYNVSATTFHNLLPFLVTVPEYPGVGNQANQARNLHDLRKLVSYANKRGVKLGLMNYSTRVDGLSDKALRDYTQKAVSLLLKQTPKLKLFGFRVGESGESAQFFSDAYLNGTKDSGRTNVRLYTRSWKTTAAETDTMAARVPGGLDVEVKYNGEQLGLPYQALLGPANSHYSYADFLQPGRHYNVIWQIRANGTHRFWTWADTEFIRRTMRTQSFGDSKGFSLEPISAYFDFDAAPWYRQSADKDVYRYFWQKNWPWYLAWGRLAYDPALPEATLIHAYEKHFGASGAKVYAAMQASGKVVPMAMAYRFTGPDQRNMSPETQSGAFDTVRHAAVTPLSFAENAPMDPRGFIGIDDFVQAKIAGKTESRIGPARVAGIFDEASQSTLKLLAQLDPTLQGNKEWRLLRTDLACAGWLGAYYTARIGGTMHLDYALKAGCKSDYDQALDLLAKSRTAWSHLAETADPVYEPIQNPLIGQKNFTWSSETKMLTKLDATIPALWTAKSGKASAAPLSISPSDRGEPLAVKVGATSQKVLSPVSAELSCVVEPAANAKSVIAWVKDFPSEAPWKAMPAAIGPDGKYGVKVPLNPGGLLYLFEVRDTQGGAAQFPPALMETPYRVISEKERLAAPNSGK